MEGARKAFTRLLLAIERERLVWHPEGATAPFARGLAELFAEP